MKKFKRCAIITVAHLLFWGDIVKKAKKYIYPFIFSVGFIVFGRTVGLIVNATTGTEGYRRLSIALLILFAWLLVVLPIYCIRYSKIILDEKLKFLFTFYNAFVLSLFSIFHLEGARYIYSSIHFVWVALLTLIPLLIRLNFTKKHHENNSNETGDSVTKV